jgi:hypothetical protein
LSMFDGLGLLNVGAGVLLTVVGAKEGASLLLGDRSMGVAKEGGKPTGWGNGAKVMVETGTGTGLDGAEGTDACGGTVIGGAVSKVSVNDETSTTSVVFRLPTIVFPWMATCTAFLKRDSMDASLYPEPITVLNP